MKEKDKFLQYYNISESEYEKANISWDVLQKIYNNYVDERYDNYQAIGNEFVKELFRDPSTLNLHSYYWRVKDPEHLLAKIIRKRTENYKKYKNLNEENYWLIVRDLIGFRGLIIFKEEWPSVHEKIISYFNDKPEWYIDNEGYSKFIREDDHYLAEPTRAHIREGDNSKMYERYLGGPNIIRKQSYRAVHYIVKYHGVCIELQLRTLFEDALGEMDHTIRYPLHVSDERLNRYAGIMNQLVGVVDELGSFYQELYREKRLVETSLEEIPKIENIKELPHDALTIKPVRHMEAPVVCLDNIIKN